MNDSHSQLVQALVEQFLAAPLEHVATLKSLAEEQPEIVWAVILQVIRRQPAEDVLGVLGSGPLEDLMWANARGFVDRAQTEAEENRVLRDLHRGIYRGPIDEESWKRIVAISGREREMFQVRNK